MRNSEIKEIIQKVELTAGDRKSLDLALHVFRKDQEAQGNDPVRADRIEAIERRLERVS